MFSAHVHSDGTLRLDSVEGRFTEVTGSSMEEFTTRGGWQAVIHPDDLQICRRHLRRLLDGFDDVVEFRHIRPDGAVRRVRLIGRPERDAQTGRVLRVVGATFDVTDQAGTLQLLHELAVATAGVLDPKVIAHLATTYAQRLVGADLVTLYLFDQASGTLHPFAATDPRVVDEDRPVAYGTGALGRACATGEALVVTDYALWEGALPSANPGIGAAAAIPLQAGGEVLGAMGITFEQPHSVPEETVEILQLLTAQVAPLLKVARLYARTERVRRVTDTALAHLQDFTLEHELVVRIADVLGAEMVGLVLLDEAGEWLTLRTAIGLAPSVTAERVSKRRGILGQVTAEGGVVAAHVAQSTEFNSLILRDSGIRSLLAAPMVVAGRLLGTVLVGKSDRHMFSADDAEVLQMVTDRMAGLVDRMRMFDAERSANAEASMQRARLSAILEQIPSGVVVLDNAGKIVLRNAASRHIAGDQHDRSRPLAEQVGDFMVRDQYGRPLEPRETPGARAMAGESLVEMEGLIRPPGANRDIFLRIAAVPLHAADGRIDGALIVYTDITRETQALHDLQATALTHARLLGELAEHEQHLSEMINSIQIPHTGTTVDATIERSRLAQLTRRESEILRLLISGLSPHQISVSSHLSAGTVKNHIGHLVAKLGVEDRTQAVLLALRLGLRPR